MSFSQEATVVSFFEDNSDLTAQQRNVRDLNGVLCALIKVQIVDSKVKFEGDIIGQPINKQNEYEVWLLNGSTYIKVAPLRSLPVDVEFSKYGINELTGGKVYVLVLDIPSNDMDNDEQWLTVDMPVNSSISVAGKKYQRPKDGILKLHLKKGKYQYELTAKNYSPQVGEVCLADEPVYLKPNLKLSTGKIIILSNKGAIIDVNGKQFGCISSINIGPGTYTFKATLAGKECKKKVTVNQEEQTVDLRFYEDMDVHKSAPNNLKQARSMTMDQITRILNNKK